VFYGDMSASKQIGISHLTDAQIARLTDAHPATVGRWRKGQNQPETADAIARLAKALGVSPAKIRPDLAKVFIT